MLPRAFTHMKAGASAVEITSRSWHVEREGKIPSGNSEMLLCCPERPEQQKERKCHFVALHNHSHVCPDFQSGSGSENPRAPSPPPRSQVSIPGCDGIIDTI